MRFFLCSQKNQTFSFDIEHLLKRMTICRLPNKAFHLCQITSAFCTLSRKTRAGARFLFSRQKRKRKPKEKKKKGQNSQPDWRNRYVEFFFTNQKVFSSVFPARKSKLQREIFSLFSLLFNVQKEPS